MRLKNSPLLQSPPVIPLSSSSASSLIFLPSKFSACIVVTLFHIISPKRGDETVEAMTLALGLHFVRPARISSKREVLNKKLAETGKPPMKYTKL